MKVKWLRLALDDLDEIYDYISKDNPKASQKIIQTIYDNIIILKSHPEMGRPGRVLGTRELYISGTPFIIPYRIKDNHIEILRIFHTSRKWPDEF